MKVNVAILSLNQIILTLNDHTDFDVLDVEDPEVVRTKPGVVLNLQEAHQLINNIIEAVLEAVSDDEDDDDED